MMAASKTSAEQSSVAILSSGGDNIDVSHLKSGEIPGVDGLRAVSILLVLVAHFGFPDRIPGGLGVTIFFFLSGFLITTLMLREAEYLDS